MLRSNNRTGVLNWLSVLTILVIGCGDSPAPVSAAPKGRVVRVALYRVLHPRALSDCEVDEALAWARERVKEAGHDFVVERRVDVPAWELTVDGNLVSPVAPEQQLARLIVAKEWLRRHGEIKKYRMHYFLYPPIEYENGQLGFGGYSFGICTLEDGGIAFGQAGAWSGHYPPRPRIGASGMILAHEAVLGHGCGMKHKDLEAGYPPNIMDHSAGRFVDTHDLRYLPVSMEEADSCLGVVRTKFIKRCLKKKKKKRCRVLYLRKVPVILRSGELNEFPVFN